MSPDKFYAQLEVLGAEYAKLDGDYQQLKSYVHGSSHAQSVNTLVKQEQLCQEIWHSTRPDREQLAFEQMILSPRTFLEEVTHGVMFSAVLSEESRAECPGEVPSSQAAAAQRPSIEEVEVDSEAVQSKAFNDDDVSRASSLTLGSVESTKGPHHARAHASHLTWGPNTSEEYDCLPAISSKSTGKRNTGKGALRSTTKSDDSDRQTMMHTNTSWSNMSAARKSKPMFEDLEDLKSRVRSNLLVDAYNVSNQYKDTGIAQAIARSTAFETLALCIIGLNAIWVGIDTDWNKEELLVNAHPVFQITEHTFCAFFTWEIVVRFCAFRYKSDVLRDGWFMFDSGLVCLMVIDTWLINLFVLFKFGSGVGHTSVLRTARILRLARMARMARLLRAMPEFLILLKGMKAAARSVFFTLMILCVLLYVFAIAFTQLLDNYEVGKQHFASVARSMHTLWLYATLLDEITELMAELEEAGLGVILLLNLLILLAGVTVMNMLVGVLVEVVSAVAASEKEETSLRDLRNKLERMFAELGLDVSSDAITKDDFQHIIEKPDAARLMQSIGVDVVQMVDTADTLFSIEGDSSSFKELSFSEFMEAVQQMRGTNFATVKDLVNLRKVLSKQLTKQEQDQLSMNRKTRRMMTDKAATKNLGSTGTSYFDDTGGPSYTRLGRSATSASTGGIRIMQSSSTLGGLDLHSS